MSVSPAPWVSVRVTLRERWDPDFSVYFPSLPQGFGYPWSRHLSDGSVSPSNDDFVVVSLLHRVFLGLDRGGGSRGVGPGTDLVGHGPSLFGSWPLPPDPFPPSVRWLVRVRIICLKMRSSPRDTKKRGIEKWSEWCKNGLVFLLLSPPFQNVYSPKICLGK